MRQRAYWATMVVALIAALSSVPVAAEATARLFTSMAGHWAGNGTLTMYNGQQENLRCRARYAVGQGDSNLQLNIRCASDSYNFDLASHVVYNGGGISGQWSETSRNASGTLAGRVDGDRIEVQAQGGAFVANLSVTTRGNRQSVAIRPQGTEVEQVSLQLNRR
jgi:hypothetical protein